MLLLCCNCLRYRDLLEIEGQLHEFKKNNKKNKNKKYKKNEDVFKTF